MIIDNFPLAQLHLEYLFVAKEKEVLSLVEKAGEMMFFHETDLWVANEPVLEELIRLQLMKNCKTQAMCAMLIDNYRLPFYGFQITLRGLWVLKVTGFEIKDLEKYLWD